MPDTAADPSFIHFLQTGELGQLRFGMSAAEVYTLLGDAGYKFDSPGMADVYILYFGNLELSFDHDTLIFIKITYRVAKGGIPAAVGVGWYKRVGKMTWDDIRPLLQAMPCDCWSITHPNDPADVNIYLPSPYRSLHILFPGDRGHRPLSFLASSFGSHPTVEWEPCW